MPSIQEFQKLQKEATQRQRSWAEGALDSVVWGTIDTGSLAMRRLGYLVEGEDFFERGGDFLETYKAKHPDLAPEIRLRKRRPSGSSAPGPGELAQHPEHGPVRRVL